MRLATITLLLLFASALTAQPKPLGAPEPLHATDPNGCAPGEAAAWLDVNAVSAAHVTTGIQYYIDLPNPPPPTFRWQQAYRLPKTTVLAPVFSQQLWLGGVVDGETRVVATQPTGITSHQALWPGLLDEAGNAPADCADFDRVWSVSRSDLLTYAETGFASPDLADWPVHLGAPVLDGDGIPDNYDLEAGDRPDLLGDQTLFWVMNDRGNAHLYTGSEPIGIEIRATAWARRSTDPAVHEATFLRYDVTYRGNTPLEDAYVSVFTDPDIGDHQTNFAGVDPERRLVYAYEGSTWTGSPYGATPPAAGAAFLATPEDTPLAGGMHLYRSWGSTWPGGEPRLPAEVYHMMQGRWRFGQPITVGGLGWDIEDGEVTTFAMASPPPAFWSMECLDGTILGSTEGCTQRHQPYDARGMISAGPFNLMPGESTSFTVATVYARGTDRLDSVVRLLDATDAVQTAFDSGVLFEPSEGVADTPEGLSGGAAPNQGMASFGAYWDTVSGAETYTVQASTRSDLGDAKSYYVTQPEVTADFGAWDPESDGFYVRVRAETPDGLSAWTELVALLVSSNEPTASAEPLAIRTVQPNPTRAGATVAFTLPETAEVRLDVVDLLGRTVRELADGPREAGAHELTFDVSGLAAGVYVLRLRSGSEQATARFTVVP